jgi:hypothetical protein
VAIADYSATSRFPTRDQHASDANIDGAAELAAALAFARADMAIRIARRDALCGVEFDSEAYDAAIVQRRAARRRIEARASTSAPAVSSTSAGEAVAPAVASRLAA